MQSHVPDITGNASVAHRALYGGDAPPASQKVAHRRGAKTRPPHPEASPHRPPGRPGPGAALAPGRRTPPAPPLPSGPFHGWAVGEPAPPTGPHRRWIKAGVPRENILSCGYWRAGKAH